MPSIRVRSRTTVPAGPLSISIPSLICRAIHTGALRGQAAVPGDRLHLEPDRVEGTGADRDREQRAYAGDRTAIRLVPDHSGLSFPTGPFDDKGHRTGDVPSSG